MSPTYPPTEPPVKLTEAGLRSLREVMQGSVVLPEGMRAEVILPEGWYEWIAQPAGTTHIVHVAAPIDGGERYFPESRSDEELAQLSAAFRDALLHHRVTPLLRREEATPEPSRLQAFHLQRDVDETGVSGEGRVAEGVVFPDGRVALRWMVGEHRTTAVHESLASVEAIHGHADSTRVVLDAFDVVPLAFTWRHEGSPLSGALSSALSGLPVQVRIGEAVDITGVVLAFENAYRYLLEQLAEER